MPNERAALTDEEWMTLISAERDGLPRCCANVSALRDAVISLAREDGEVDNFFAQEFRRAYGWVFPEHGEPSPALAKLAAAVGDTDRAVAAVHEVRTEWGKSAWAVREAVAAAAGSLRHALGLLEGQAEDG